MPAFRSYAHYHPTFTPLTDATNHFDYSSQLVQSGDLAHVKDYHSSLDSQATEVLQHSVSAATARRQNTQLNKFLAWCDEKRIAEQDRSPPSEILLCNYFSTFATKTSMATAKAHRAAIKKWVERRGLQWKGAALLDGIMKGINNTIPPTSRRPTRAPVRVDHLRALMDVTAIYSSPNFIACRDAAASTAFYGLLRLGEILPETEEDLASLPRVRNLSITSFESQGILFLPKTKTAQISGERVVIPKIQSRTDPIYLLLHYIEEAYTACSGLLIPSYKRASYFKMGCYRTMEFSTPGSKPITFSVYRSSLPISDIQDVYRSSLPISDIQDHYRTRGRNERIQRQEEEAMKHWRSSRLKQHQSPLLKRKQQSATWMMATMTYLFALNVWPILHTF
ncbi:hypothetical protein EV360DRAFT_75898 [Lentinula raphanica]|nr:hypothetical protein EV360DRAFT_75898 [Lentinula raphanica]